MFGKLFLLFTAVPLIELYLLLTLGQFIGPWYTVLIVITTGLVGALLAKLEGMRVWYQVQQELQQFKMPGDRLIDGVLVLIGGVLLITPGVLTDVLGFSLIIPPSRAVIREIVKKKMGKKVSQKTHVKVIDMR